MAAKSGTTVTWSVSSSWWKTWQDLVEGAHDEDVDVDVELLLREDEGTHRDGVDQLQLTHIEDESMRLRGDDVWRGARRHR